MAAETVKKKRSIKKFAKEIRSELKKVIWPNRKQLINNTISVLLACLIIGAIIWVSDWILGSAITNSLVK